MRRDALRLVVGAAAVAAPALHVATDFLEWRQGGFTSLQLWLNYAAFLPMPWLLFGVYAVHEPRPPAYGLAGALLYGAAFTYFAFTTLYAIVDGVRTYGALWQALGAAYTVHGGLMVAGGFLFGAALLRAGQMPRPAVVLFLAGLSAALLLAVLPLPEAWQTLGSVLRNLGLVAIGAAILRRPRMVTVSRQDSAGKY